MEFHCVHPVPFSMRLSVQNVLANGFLPQDAALQPLNHGGVHLPRFEAVLEVFMECD